jgi:hypothetical protein
MAKRRKCWPFQFPFALYDYLNDEQKVEAEIQIFALLKRLAFGQLPSMVVPTPRARPEYLRLVIDNTKGGAHG